MQIIVTTSPFPQDGNLPWKYDESGFLDWYNEVFEEADDSEINIDSAIDNLRAAGYEIFDSMYRGKHVFHRSQLLFMIEAILVAALDRIESGMPTSCVTWEDRLNCRSLTPYDHGVLEQTGMSLAVLYAQLTGDGISIGDALVVADKFDNTVREWVETTWSDNGEAVLAKMKSLGSGGWRIEDAYTNYPDCRKHAEAYLTVFDDYLLRHQEQT